MGNTSRFGLFEAYGTVAAGSAAEDVDEAGSADEDESGTAQAGLERTAAQIARECTSFISREKELVE